MMGLHAEITKAAGSSPDADPMAVAARLIRSFKRNDLVRLVAEEVAHAQRALAAATEQAAFRSSLTERHGSTFNPLTAPSFPSDRSAGAEAFRALYATRFALGDGTQVAWGEATIEQHEQRIAFLAKLRDGLNATIERHREAIRIISEAGTSCLAEIAEAVAA